MIANPVIIGAIACGRSFSPSETTRRVAPKSWKKSAQSMFARCEADTDCHTFVGDDEESHLANRAAHGGWNEHPRQARPPERDVRASSVFGPDGLQVSACPTWRYEAMKRFLLVLILATLTTGCRSTSSSYRPPCGAPTATCPPGTTPVPLPP